MSAPEHTRHALVAGVSANSLALARALMRDGHRVTLARTRPVDPALASQVDALAAAGARVGELRAPDDDVDVVYPDGYSGPSRSSAWMADVRARGIPVSNQTAYVLAHARTPILGVTGTAGKSSVTALVVHLLRGAGVAAHTASDLGPETQLLLNHEIVDALDELRSGLIVAELGSQGLVSLDASPAIGVLTNLSPDHIDDHGSYEAYVDAKRGIVRHQSGDDWAVLPREKEALAAFLPHCGGRVATFGGVDDGRDAGVHVNGDRIVGRLDGIEVDLGRAPDEPISRANALAACAAALVAGADPVGIAASLPTFPGLRFRREVVAEVDGILAVNDGLAVTPTKAHAGLEALDRPIVWVLGGQATFRSETELDASAPAALRLMAEAARGRVRQAFVFGVVGPRLVDVLRAAGVDATEMPDLEAAVAGAAGAARAGDVVLLAPAVYLPPAERARFDDLVRAGLARRS